MVEGRRARLVSKRSLRFRCHLAGDANGCGTPYAIVVFLRGPSYPSCWSARSSLKHLDLDAIRFTHLHVDHSADLPALVKASYFTGRDRDLPIYGPAGDDRMPTPDAWLASLFAAPARAWHYFSEYPETDRKNDYKLRPRTVTLAAGERFTETIGPFRIAAVPVVHTPSPPSTGGWTSTTARSPLGDARTRTRTLETLAEGSDPPARKKGRERPFFLCPAHPAGVGITAPAAGSAPRSGRAPLARPGRRTCTASRGPRRGFGNPIRP